MSLRVILWDFDGTLAFRPGMWRGCLVEVLDEHLPGHTVSPEDLVPFLRQGFPWQSPEVAHPELSTPKAWWRVVEAVLTKALAGVGVDPIRARELAQLAHLRYVEPSSWRVFDDTRPVLAELARRGWTNVVLSNHVPELPRIVEGVGLGDTVDSVVTSALTGYEKPHPEAFLGVLRGFGHPAEVWVVGDNVVSDVLGAQAVGIPAILVRSSDDRVERQARNLYGVYQFLLPTTTGTLES